MYRIDKFLSYYKSLEGTQAEYDGTWVNVEPLPFYDGFLTINYWKKFIKRLKDSIWVLKGKAHAVTWEK